MIRGLSGAILMAAAVSSVAWAAEPPRFDNHVEAALCSAYFQTAVDRDEIDTAAGRRGDPAFAARAKRYRDLAVKIARARGAAEHVPPKTVQADLDNAVRSVFSDFTAGRLDGDKPGTTPLEVYLRNCAFAVDNDPAK